jgi:23S rRNA (cytosine1962-C5)-methyltransferase
MTDAIPKILLSKQANPKTIRGMPWVFSNQLTPGTETKGLVPGSLVRLTQADGRLLGIYHYNPHTLIAARLLTRNTDREIDRGFFEERLGRALALREKLFDRPFYRLAHGEADGLPGLVIDRYGDTCVVQPGSAGMDGMIELVLAALERVVAPDHIIVQADGPARAMEGLEPLLRVAKGAPPAPLPVEENGFAYLCDPLGGQKTGWFYDHRDNRAFAASLVRGGAMLDLYAYAGAFGLLAAQRGAGHVTLVDRSAASLELAKAAAQSAGLAAKITAKIAEAFDWAEKTSDWFDVVVADPPAFAKSRKDLAPALKGYQKLARLATGLVKPGGFLCLASCSHHADVEAFLAACTAGIREAGRQPVLIRQSGAGTDHPVHPLLPQTAYLKFLAFALD